MLCVALAPPGPACAETARYVVEDINDAAFDAYPPPAPTQVVEESYDITSTRHEAVVDVTSRQLRNLSVTIENFGPGLVSEPYLRGPRGWDFRDLDQVVGSITGDPSLTGVEKLYRVHEWKGLHVVTVLGSSYSPYSNADFSGNPLRILNQYGYAMCGQSTNTSNNLLLHIQPPGSYFGRVAKIGSHRTGEAFFDGVWHAFDTTPGTGVVQWIYYDRDNETIVPTWKRILSDPFLATRMKPWTGASAEKYLPDATGETFDEGRAFLEWDFNYSLRPGESLTMFHDMRGRLDLTSARHDNSDMYRCYSDYGSAVFTYRPGLANGSYRPYALEESNVVSTPLGLEPADTTRPSHVVFECRSAWCFVGADIEASFATTGKVSIAVNADPYDLQYPTSPRWTRLSATQKEYGGSSIEGRMVYWVKLEFEGAGSGLRAATLASEVQMSPWSMPRLEYGKNRLLFTARSLGGSRLRVTHRIDTASPFHFQDAVTSNQGRVLPIRVGGILQQGSKLGSSDYRKGAFWRRLRDEPGAHVDVRVEILQMRGRSPGTVVRTLVSRSLPYAFHSFYWDGRDDSGRVLEPGPYAYRLSINGKVIHGERLYLYASLWPEANEPPGASEPPPDDGFVAGDYGGVAVADIPAGLSPGGGVSPWSTAVDTLLRGGTGGVVGADPVDPGAGEPVGPPPPEEAPPEGSPHAGDGLADGAAAPLQDAPLLPLPDPWTEPPAGEHGFAPSIPPGEILLDGDEVQPEPTGLLTIDRLKARVRLVRRTSWRRGAAPDVLDLRAWILDPEWSSASDPGALIPGAGTYVRMSVGGVVRTLVLDRRGRGRSEDKTLRISFQRPRKVGDPPGLRLKLRLRGVWADEWADEGFFPAEESVNEPLTLAIQLEIDDQVFATDVSTLLDTVPEKKAVVRFPGR